MHIMIIEFGLEDLTVEEFREQCKEIAPAWAEIPGLNSKIWLENPDENSYGGVYTWESRDAMQRYFESEQYEKFANHPSFTDVTVSDYAVIEEPTRTTRGMERVTA